MLSRLDKLPDGFLDVEGRHLYRLLDGPTLIHLPGTRSDTLFVSIMLHGNEDTGLKAVQALLAHYRGRPLPRRLSLFIGNLAAAREGIRRLNGQPDYNRVWPGTDAPESPESRMMAKVTEEMSNHRLFASIDVHNNTGLNPHYACVNVLNSRFLQLASLFGRNVVYFTHPRGVQSQAFAQFCPAVTLECGRVGQRHGTHHAQEFIDACLHMDHIPTHPVATHDLDLFHTVAQVKIPEEISFSFNDCAADLRLDPTIERLNFRELWSGTALGWARRPKHLQAINEAGEDVSAEFFETIDNELRITKALMPAMITLDERIIRQDCLCYLMERIAPPSG
jgi:succinylglutamate desuccinylase